MKKAFMGIVFLVVCILSGQSQILYTALPEGGSFGKGTLAKYVIGTNTAVAVHHFGSGSDGVNPLAVPIQTKDGKLYGTTGIGGLSNAGTLYSFNPADSTYQKLFDFGGVSGTNPYGKLWEAPGGKLYGMTYNGGTTGYGTIYCYDPFTGLTTVSADFDGTNGRQASGGLMQASNGKIYGVTVAGGVDNIGNIFLFDPASGTITSLYQLVADPDPQAYRSYPDGANPYGELVQGNDGKLYGTTFIGGMGAQQREPGGTGVIFSFDPTTNTYTKLKDLYPEVATPYPYATLLKASDGLLYEASYAAGLFTGGIGSYNPASGAYSLRWTANDPSAGSYYTYSDLMQASNGKVYGLAWQSDGGLGSIYSFDINTSQVIKAVDLKDGANGARPGPHCGLVEIKAAPPSGCTVPTLSAAITNVSCKGSSTGGIVLTTRGGSSPFTYAWTGPNAFSATTKDLSNVKAGLYSVKVTGTGGCYFNASYRVSEPLAPLAINLAQGVITCYGGTTNVAVYGSGGTTPYTGTGTFANKAAGTYTYTITDAKGCSATGSITVVQPAAIVSSVVITPVSCKGSSTGGIDLSVSGGVGNFGYSWTGPNGFTATTQDITNVKGGIYSVRVSSGQCYTNATYRVTEPLAPLGASIAASTIVCAGGTTNVYISPSGGTTPYTGGGNIPNQAAGPHSYTVTDARGCTYVVSINIPAGTGAKPTKPVITGPSSVTPNQANVQFTASTSGASGYSWVVPVGASITSGQNTSAIRVKFGTTGGQVKVTATNGCGSTAQVSKTVTTGSARLITKTIVAPLTAEQYFTTSPNPAQGMVTVKFSAARSDRKFEIRVSDVNGKTMFTKSGLTAAGQNMLKLDMTKYSSSLYFITLISEDQIQTQKLIRAK